MSPKKVCIIGSGNWGSAIAKLVGENTASHPDLFVEETPIWVYEEVVNGRKLTEIINTDHENVKYLPQFRFGLQGAGHRLQRVCRLHPS